MKNLEKNTNPIVEYNNLIQSGRVRTSKKVKTQYQYLTWLLENSEIYEYDDNQANKAIDFIHTFCKHSKGTQGGKPFVLELWQRAFVASIFGIVNIETRKRKHRKATLIVGRKNGKSTLSAAIALFMLIMDGEFGAEVYAVATKKDQAKIIWNEGKRMIAKSPHLKKNTRTRVADILYGDSIFMPLGRDSDTLDGLNVHCATFDEVHAWKDQNLYDVIVDGTSSRDNWLILTITTAGTVRESVYDIMYGEGSLQIQNLENYQSDDFQEYDPTLLFVAYELDHREEWKEEENWIKANPGLGTIKGIDNLRSKVRLAKSNTSRVKNLLTKDFNIPETGHDSWLALDSIKNGMTYRLAIETGNEEDLKPRYAIGGFDLSNTTDLTCATILFRIPNDPMIYVKQMYWIPEELLETRVQEDKVPYDIWHDRGLLRLCQGNKINTRDVYDWFIEVQSDLDIYIYKIGYDRWHSSFLVDELKSYFGPSALVDVAQGVKTLSTPMFSLGADLKSKRINFDSNPILEWCMTNVSVKEDVNGNIQPQKTQNPRRRIDGFAALLDAYVVYLDEHDNYLAMI